MEAQTGLAKRIRSIRIRLGYTQNSMAEAIGSKLRSWQEWETGNRIPSGQALTGLSRLGVNVNWILTGEGAELVAEMAASFDLGPSLDRDLLEDIHMALHEYQNYQRIRWSPDQEAKLVGAVYKCMIEQGSPNKKDRQRTLNLVRMLMEEVNVEP